MAVNVAFNGSSLSTWNGTNGIIVNTIEHAGKSAKRAEAYALSHGNASAIPFVDYPSKPIELQGQIVGTSISDCDSQIDTFNSLLTAQNANLDFDYNGGSLNRRYVGTFTNLDVVRPGNLAWANFQALFTTISPFGKDTATTTAVTASGRTSSSYSDSYTFLGTAPSQLPIATVTYSAITGGTNATVTFGNAATGQQLSLTRTWASTDVLIFDSTLRTVTVNGVVMDFSGAFPEFVPGASTITYSDSFSTRTFNYSVVYYKAYL